MAAAALRPHAALAAGSPRPAVFFTPGAAQDDLLVEGVPITRHPRLARGLRPIPGTPCLLTRFSEADGAIDRAVLPVVGHSVDVRSDGGSAVVAGKHTTLVRFDPQSLDLLRHAEFEDGIHGSGHAVHLPDGSLAVGECRHMVAWSGTPEAHFGRISIRDSETLETLALYSSGGMFPHEISLLEDGRHLAIAHYGSTGWPRGQAGFDRYRVEPSLVVMELSSGRIVERYVPPSPSAEYRHVAAHALDRIFVMQNALVPIEHFHEAMGDRSGGETPGAEPERRVTEGSFPLLHLDFTRPVEAGRANALAADRDAMFRGQSLVYDPVHDEVLATFTRSQSVVAFSAADGRPLRVVRTDRLGLRDPRGIALHPDGLHYAVSGTHQDVFLFRRGDHTLVPERRLHAPTRQVSHLTAA